MKRKLECMCASFLKTRDGGAGSDLLLWWKSGENEIHTYSGRLDYWGASSFNIIYLFFNEHRDLKDELTS